MDLILEKDLYVTAADMRRHIPLPFRLPKDYARLHLYFTYGPKTVAEEALALKLVKDTLAFYSRGNTLDNRKPEDFLPVQNLITLSLDCGDTYVGAAHRHPSRQHIIISGEQASPGFIPHVVHAGSWTVTVSLHAVSNPVTCKIRVLGEDQHEI